MRKLLAALAAVALLALGATGARAQGSELPPPPVIFGSEFDTSTSIVNLAVGGVADTKLQEVYAKLVGRAGGQTLEGGTASGENLTLSSTHHGTKGKLLFGISAYDETANQLAIGHASPLYSIHVLTSPTNTSGTLNTIFQSTTLSPATNSTATWSGINSTVVTAASAANKGATVTAITGTASRSSSDTGAITTFRGINVAVLNTQILSTGQGAVTTLEAGTFNAYDNSSTTTATTTLRGLSVGAASQSNNSGSRTYTNHQGLVVSLNNNSPATATNLQGLLLSSTNNGGGTWTTYDILSIGTPVGPTTAVTSTWGTLRGIRIQDLKPTSSGGGSNTLTNPPEAFRIESQTATSALSIRQLGTAPNRFQAATTIGADADATAGTALDVQSTTLAFKLPVLTSATISGLTAANGMSAYDSTNGYVRFVQGGSWTTINPFQNAAADGATKGVAGFNSGDFTASAGIISIKTAYFTEDDATVPLTAAKLPNTGTWSASSVTITNPTLDASGGAFKAPIGTATAPTTSGSLYVKTNNASGMPIPTVGDATTANPIGCFTLPFYLATSNADLYGVPPTYTSATAESTNPTRLSFPMDVYLTALRCSFDQDLLSTQAVSYTVRTIAKTSCTSSPTDGAALTCTSWADSGFSACTKTGTAGYQDYDCSQVGKTAIPSTSFWHVFIDWTGSENGINQQCALTFCPKAAW